MKRKYLGLVAVALLGSASVSNMVGNTKSGIVQAASKKTKVTKFKTYHNQYLWGPYRGKTTNLNKIGYYADGATFSTANEHVEYPDLGYDKIEGYAKINGKKYYYSRDSWDGSKIYYNPLALKKPTVYRANSNITLYQIAADNVIIQTLKLKKGEVVGVFNYLKPYTITKSLSSKVKGGKFIEVLLPNGCYSFIRASDLKKFTKGGTGTGYLNFKKVEGAEKKWATKYNKTHKKKIVYGGLSWK